MNPLDNEVFTVLKRILESFFKNKIQSICSIKKRNCRSHDRGSKHSKRTLDFKGHFGILCKHWHSFLGIQRKLLKMAKLNVAKNQADKPEDFFDLAVNVIVNRIGDAQKSGSQSGNLIRRDSVETGCLYTEEELLKNSKRKEEEKKTRIRK